MTCELCTLERKINIYIEDDHYIIMDCDSCFVPMMVWKDHTMSLPDPDIGVMLESQLSSCARMRWGDIPFFIDKKQRAILDHLHWHARKIEE